MLLLITQKSIALQRPRPRGGCVRGGFRRPHWERHSPLRCERHRPHSGRGRRRGRGRRAGRGGGGERGGAAGRSALVGLFPCRTCPAEGARQARSGQLGAGDQRVAHLCPPQVLPRWRRLLSRRGDQQLPLKIYNRWRRLGAANFVKITGAAN